MHNRWCLYEMLRTLDCVTEVTRLQAVLFPVFELRTLFPAC